eukprot:3179261-Prymnesium_polylepis.1
MDPSRVIEASSELVSLSVFAITPVRDSNERAAQPMRLPCDNGRGRSLGSRGVWARTSRGLPSCATSGHTDFWVETGMYLGSKYPGNPERAHPLWGRRRPRGGARARSDTPVTPTHVCERCVGLGAVPRGRPDRP